MILRLSHIRGRYLETARSLSRAKMNSHYHIRYTRSKLEQT